jgi:tetratricopeptide (TPR) repeat protein
VVEDSYVLPVDVEVHSVQPHAHYRATEVQGWATLPDGTRRWLVYIRKWDFNWQDVYRYADPMGLPKGTTLAMRYVYDNSASNPRNPYNPPQRAVSGQRSSDEMGDLWIQVFTKNQGDRVLLNRDFRPKMVREDIEGYKMLLAVMPDVPGLHDDVALLYAELGDADQTIRHFEAALRLKPKSAAAHYNLGTALSLAGRSAEAIREYEAALNLDPRYALARNNLGFLLMARGQHKDALTEFREALAIDPGYAEALYNMGLALSALGNEPEAVQSFRRALQQATAKGLDSLAAEVKTRLEGQRPR